jgi:acetoacetyl-CoA synthetase
MARFHVEALRHIQPRGPYFLAGFSFGGLVAFEMAQMLTAAGEEVASLSLLDSFPHTKFWPLRARIASWRQLVKFSGAKSTLTRLADYHCSAIRGKSAWIKAAYIAGRSVRALRLTFDIFRLGAWLQRFADFAAHDGQGSWSNPNVELPATVLEVQRAGDIAYRTYRPQYYDGEITFIKADREMRIPFDARVLWAGLVRRMTVMAVPSDHQNLVRSGTADLARLLTECIATAQPR